MHRVRETHVGERMALQEKMNVIGAELECMVAYLFLPSLAGARSCLFSPSRWRGRSARDRLNERVEELTATLQGEGETIVTCRMEVQLAQLLRYRSKEGRHYQATTLQLMPCLPSLVIKPRPAFRCLQYGKAGEGLVHFLM